RAAILRRGAGHGDEEPDRTHPRDVRIDGPGAGTGIAAPSGDSGDAALRSRRSEPRHFRGPDAHAGAAPQRPRECFRFRRQQRQRRGVGERGRNRSRMTMTALSIEIRAASFFATRFASAEQALAGTEREATAPQFALLVGRSRRFTSLLTQLHIEGCGALAAMATGRPSVFATCHGEIQTAHRILGECRDAGEVSSARFAQSVHNTASGLYAFATGNTAPSTTITGANAVAAGWLEAALIAQETGGPVLLSIADEPVPAAFRGP